MTDFCCTRPIVAQWISPWGRAEAAYVHPSRIPDVEARKHLYGKDWQKCSHHLYSWSHDGMYLRCLECGLDLT